MSGYSSYGATSDDMRGYEVRSSGSGDCTYGVVDGV